MRWEQLRQAAVAIVAESGRCTPHELQRRLRRDFGATPSEAHRTIGSLIRDGRVRRTAFGEFVLRGVGHRGSGGGYRVWMKLVMVVLMLALIAWMAWAALQGTPQSGGVPASVLGPLGLP